MESPLFLSLFLNFVMIFYCCEVFCEENLKGLQVSEEAGMTGRQNIGSIAQLCLSADLILKYSLFARTFQVALQAGNWNTD